MKFLIYIFSLSLLSSAMVVPVNSWTAITVEDMAKETKKIESVYKVNVGYSFTISHITYKNYTTLTPEDKMTGYYIKDAKNNYHSYILGVHTIQNSKVKITVDSVNKSIQINSPDRSFTKEVKLSEVEEMLKICSAVKKQDVTTGKKFRMEFSKTKKYSAYEVWVNSSSQLEKLVMYFNAEFPSNPNDEKSAKTKPRAEVVFADYKTGIKPLYKDYFDEAKYITLKGDGYVASSAYKDYKIYDLRVKTK
ncbi:MAG: hypothetical protein ACK40M_06275 [Flavobacteriales bacterium]